MTMVVNVSSMSMAEDCFIMEMLSFGIKLCFRDVSDTGDKIYDKTNIAIADRGVTPKISEAAWLPWTFRYLTIKNTSI